MEDRREQLEKLRALEEQLAKEALRKQELLAKKRREMGSEETVIPREVLDKQPEPGDKSTPEDAAKKLREIEKNLAKQAEKQGELLEAHREREEEIEEDEEDPNASQESQIIFTSDIPQEETKGKTIVEAVPVTERPQKEELAQEADKERILQQEKLTREQNKLKKRKKTALLGFVVLLLVVVGAVSIVSLVFAKGKDLLTGKNKIEEYQSFIAPLVLVDPAPFSAPGQLDQKVRLESAIWSLFMNTENANRYTQDERGLTVIPAADVHSEAAKLFGPGLPYSNESFGNSFFTFYYDKALNSYKVPATGKNTMAPRITKAENIDGNSIRLTVEYVPIVMSSAQTDNSRLQAEKTLYYILKKEGRSYFITAVEYPEGRAPAPAQASDNTEIEQEGNTPEQPTGVPREDVDTDNTTSQGTEEHSDS